jgi:signal transduction histidine kinase
MKEDKQLDTASFADQVFQFRCNILGLRGLFYLFILLLSILSYSNSPGILLISALLFLSNLTSYITLKASRLNPLIVIYIQQLLNVILLSLLVLYSGRSNSPFILLFLIEGLFCGIFYNLKCVFLFFALSIPFMITICFYDYNGRILPILAIIATIFATASTFLIIREQDNRKGELISYYLKLEKLNARLTSISRLRKNFMDIAYHDMKSPLATVTGFIQNILSGYGGPVTEKQQEWLNRCVDRLEALSRQINDLYFLANIESTDFNEVKKRCDISQELELAISEVIDRINKKKQRFIKNIPSNLPWVVVVPILFRQCVVNLLGNASKYTPIGGTIELDVEYDENWLTIIIKDTGIGIPDEYKPRIFDEFFRVKNVTVDNQKVSGTGLGLTIVKSIVDGHGGTIEVKDNHPRGTIFIVRFPMVEGYREA